MAEDTPTGTWTRQHDHSADEDDTIEAVGVLLITIGC